LGFTAAERRAGLSKPNIAKSDLRQSQAGIIDFWHRSEKRCRLIDRHIEYVRDIHPFVVNFQGLAIIPAAIARFAGDVYRRQKMHFDFNQSVALALLASPALDVETETTRLIAADFGGGQFGKEIANLVKHSRVSRRITPRRSANRRLVDNDDFVEHLEPAQEPMASGLFFGTIEFAEQCAA
jgi:hypothetical protein